ncbi:MAG: hypothetical protein DRR16_10940 [Candidatus Parabeggiatoa sp. nov. 3]|nr:MAG: hypothetical protein DRR00_16225 [Gammaproteobacteria bacterium]RKZ57822.1 MAG: hypothetical protein DRQ99_26345 [Gammaproteobacteria bacterium]RKZ85913.1 MAG: hypothetical protein DRR16_10940 [Gammaproteobacteria bacterium]
MIQSKIIRPFVEINLAEHCNLTCALCDHYAPFLPEKYADIEATHGDLMALSTVLHTNHLLLLGGEPLLHPEFDEFCRMAKSVQISHQLVLVTNGILLHRMSSEAWQMIDGIRISRYPGVKISVKRKMLEAQARKYNVWIWESDVKMFDITESTAEITDQCLRNTIFTNCLMGHICNTIHDGRYYRCPPSVFIQTRLSKRGVELDNHKEDSVMIQNNSNLKAELEMLLFRSDPLEACRYCLGGLGRKEPHKMLNKKESQQIIGLPMEQEFNYSEIREDFVYCNATK